MRKAIIVTLAAVNVALLLTLLLGGVAPRAEAQVLRGGNDYLMVTGNIGTSWEAVYIADLANRRLLALRYDKTTRRLAPLGNRRLADDFRRTQEQP